MALGILKQMDGDGVKRNEITFSSCISACEKSGNYEIAIDLLDQMERECEAKSVIPYNGKYVRTYVSKKATSVARRGLVDCMLYIEY